MRRKVREFGEFTVADAFGSQFASEIFEPFLDLGIGRDMTQRIRSIQTIDKVLADGSGGTARVCSVLVSDDQFSDGGKEFFVDFDCFHAAAVTQRSQWQTSHLSLRAFAPCGALGQAACLVWWQEPRFGLRLTVGRMAL